MTQAREPDEFWVPNRVIDEMDALGGYKALLLYCLLARQPASDGYPSAQRLACCLRCKTAQVWRIIELLYNAGLLNDHDFDELAEATRRESNEIAVRGEVEDENGAFSKRIDERRKSSRFVVVHPAQR